MALRINDTIPNRSVETDQGTIHLHDWVGDGWAGARIKGGESTLPVSSNAGENESKDQCDATAARRSRGETNHWGSE